MRLSSNVIKQVNCELESCAVVYSNVDLAPKNQPEELPPLIDMEKVEQEAAAILAQARTQADELIAQAHSRTEQIERDAYEKGHATGYQDGYQKGLQVAKANEEQARRQFDHAAENLLQEIDSLQSYVYRETEKEMIGLAVEIAEKLVGRQLDIRPDTIVDLAKNACVQARDSKQIVLYVSPEQLDAVKVRQDEIEELFYRSEHFVVAADPGITAGGCRVETECGYIDAQRETMSEQVKKIIKEA